MIACKRYVISLQLLYVIDRILKMEKIEFNVWLAQKLKEEERSIMWLARKTKLDRTHLGAIVRGDAKPHESTKSLIRIVFGYQE